MTEADVRRIVREEFRAMFRDEFRTMLEEALTESEIEDQMGQWKATEHMRLAVDSDGRIVKAE